MGRPSKKDADKSRERFIEAAEQIFIREGYDRCTIRAISAEAGTSLALLNRQWDSKRHLFEDVFKRHFDPIHQAQNARFDALEAEGRLTPRFIIEAFLNPAMIGSDAGPEAQTSHMIYCRALTDPSGEVKSIARPLVTQIRKRLITLLRHALPHLSENQFFFAMVTVLGAYVYSQTSTERLADVMETQLDTIDWSNAASIIAEYLDVGLSHAHPAEK